MTTERARMLVRRQARRSRRRGTDRRSRPQPLALWLERAQPLRIAGATGALYGEIDETSAIPSRCEAERAGGKARLAHRTASRRKCVRSQGSGGSKSEGSSR